ncbi:hypothetical protein L484_007042 [Morus notabilis]|uniref:Retrovirus-related Pol polyprotein from transposon TNT 1-94 n=1 Tax=Morus notabilis TaxID=981085 RepID=W9RMW7_9ROSA|nr:hypothetical protein L484_007042 [Morus notabilis]
MVGNDSASELWNSLTLTFTTQSKAKIMQYKLQIQTLKKCTMSMHEYLTKMKAYCDVLASVGHKISDEDHILHILSSLGTKYVPVMVTITSRTEPWTVKDVGTLLISFETRLERGQPISTDGSLPLQILLSKTRNRGVVISDFTLMDPI